MSLLLLLFAPLALRYASRWVPTEREATSRWVWAIAVLAALLWTSFGTHYLAAYHMGPPPLDDDFRDYCTTAAVLSGTLGEGLSPYALRPPFPQLPAALFAHFEALTDAMRHSAWLTTVLSAVVVFAWARLLGGLTAATVALLAFPAFAPLATSAHQFTGYPQLALMYATAAYCLCLGMKIRGPKGVALCSGGASLALLGDQFAFVWAGLPLVAGVGLAIASQARMRSLAALLIPLTLSYGLANALPPELDFFPDDRKPVLQTLEQRLSDHDVYLESQGTAVLDDTTTAPGIRAKVGKLINHGSSLQQVDEAANDPGFYWGRAGPADVWSAIKTATKKRSASTSQHTVLEANQLAPRQTKTAMVCIVLGLMASIWRLRAAPTFALGAGLSAIPFLLWLTVLPKLGPKLSPDFLNDTATYILWLDHKLLLPGVIAAPVFLGVTWALLSSDASDYSKSHDATPGKGWRRPVLAGMCATLLVTGILPSWLSPYASWRTQVGGNTGAVEAELRDAQTTSIDTRDQKRPTNEHPMMPCRLRLASDIHDARQRATAE